MTNILHADFLNKTVERELELAPADETDAIQLTTAISSWFVRRDNKFYDLDNLGTALSKPDIQRVCLHRFSETFPDIKLSSALLREVFTRAIDVRTSSIAQSIPVWSGKRVCLPGSNSRLIWKNGSVSVNTWVRPAYRSIEAAPSLGISAAFFFTMFPRAEERAMFLDWLAWCLQNETDKPSWAPFLYSRTKGSGKSTLCQLVIKLFGDQNSITQNSVDKLTSRFNMTILQSKLVVSEELQLRPDSSQGNTLKTYITEKATLSEQKGREAERIEQSCCFLFTTNHLPIWIEAEDRRYYVIEIDHVGHASGPGAAEFAALVEKLHAFMGEPEKIAGLYQYLMARRVAETFNAKSLNIAKDSTAVMQRIQGASRQTSLERLEELLNEQGKNAISEADVTALMAEKIRGNINSTKHLMTELGWSKTKVKWGGVDYARARWVRQGFSVSDGKIYGTDSSQTNLSEHLELNSFGSQFEVIG
jgi:hypothetical protein